MRFVKFNDISWNNTSNKGHFSYGGTYLPADMTVWNETGCCQAFRGFIKNNSCITVYVNKKEADRTLSTIGLTMDEYLNELNVFDLPRPIEWGERDSNYYFNIDNSRLQKKVYYSFCWIRHLYYQQKVVTNYFRIINELEFTEVDDKLLTLGFCGYYAGGYTLISCMLNQSRPKSNFFNLINNHNMGNNESTAFIYYTELAKKHIPILHSCSSSKQTSPEGNPFVVNYEEFHEMFVVPLLNFRPRVVQCSTRTGADIVINDQYYYKIDPLKGSSCKLAINSISIIPLGLSYSFNRPYFKFPEIVGTNYLTVFSRHPSHAVFRKNEELKFEKKVLIRLGSTTKTKIKYDLELNTIDSITNSGNKLLMKQCFADNDVPTAPWTADIERAREFEFPIVAKNIFGSRGTGNYKLDSVEALNEWSARRELKNYIFESYLNYAKEYRIHVSRNGVFLSWRKLRRNDTPDDQRWFFNNSNCNWVSDKHELYDRPKVWDEMCRAAQDALNAVGLHIGGVDIRVQSNKLKTPKFAIIEINSACSQSSVTTQAYTTAIRNLVGE